MAAVVARSLRLLLEIDVGKLLPVIVPHDEAGVVEFFDSPGRREAATSFPKRKDRPFDDSRSLPRAVGDLPLSYDRRRGLTLANVLRAASNAQKSQHRGHA